MDEPTCVMHPCSPTNPPPSFPLHIPQENSAMYGIEESVSFGRFVSDNLEWEKWSSFNNNRNRYVQEAEKYSRPGSVAQKKAYFEAHFKRMAALKAAALLEQTNSLQSSSPEKNKGQGIDCSMGSIQSIGIDVQMESNNYKHDQNVEKHCEHEEAKAYVNDISSDGTKNETKENLCENIGQVEPVQPSNRNKVYSVPVKDEAFNGSNEIQSCGPVLKDQPPLKKRSSFIEEAVESIVKKNPPLSSYMSPAVGRGTARASLFEDSTTKFEKSVYPGKENFVTPTKKKTSVTDQDKKKTPLRLSINREFNRIISPVIRKIGTSSKVSKDCSTPLKTPAKCIHVPKYWQAQDKLTYYSKFVLFEWRKGFKKKAGNALNTFFRITMLRSSEHFILFVVFILQKLEDKFNATAIERPPQSSKFKEKAEAELNKFRQSFCFKAMSSPDHLGENEALTSPKQKNASTQGKSPKRGKQSAKISKSFLPPQRPSNSVK
ncbi:hypothetical protein KSS87_012783 [Heliosperma pusillum]|nr:hypothetical protein KSS87_012783 [Heliosperma pusillum]